MRLRLHKNMDSRDSWHAKSTGHSYPKFQDYCRNNKEPDAPWSCPSTDHQHRLSSPVITGSRLTSLVMIYFVLSLPEANLDNNRHNSSLDISTAVRIGGSHFRFRPRRGGTTSGLCRSTTFERSWTFPAESRSCSRPCRWDHICFETPKNSRLKWFHVFFMAKRIKSNAYFQDILAIVVWFGSRWGCEWPLVVADRGRPGRSWELILGLSKADLSRDPSWL